MQELRVRPGRVSVARASLEKEYRNQEAPIESGITSVTPVSSLPHRREDCRGMRGLTDNRERLPIVRNPELCSILSLAVDDVMERQGFVVRRNILSTNHFLAVVSDHFPVMLIKLLERDMVSRGRFD